jgi:hypothetical protein
MMRRTDWAARDRGRAMIGSGRRCACMGSHALPGLDGRPMRCVRALMPPGAAPAHAFRADTGWGESGADRVARRGDEVAGRRIGIVP